MTYVITASCVNTKDASCVEVCPVDCIHPTPQEPEFADVDMLYIDPDSCIDCDACVATCPVGAPMPLDLLPKDSLEYAEINSKYFASRSQK